MIKLFIMLYGALRDLGIQAQAVKEIARGGVDKPKSKETHRQQEQDGRQNALDNMLDHFLI